MSAKQASNHDSQETTKHDEGKSPPASHGPGEHDAADKNARFVQVSTDHLNAWGELCVEYPFAAKLLFCIVQRMGKSNNALVCSYKTLQEILGVSRTTVAKAVQHLKKNNWIAAVRIGSATAYCVNERVVWQSKRGMRKYAMFSATVVASETEQEKDFFEKFDEKLNAMPFIHNEERVLTNDDSEPPAQSHLDLD